MIMDSSLKNKKETACVDDESYDRTTDETGEIYTHKQHETAHMYPRQEIDGCHLYIPQYYRPIRIIGRGAFGTVVLCFDERMRRPVAIKKILGAFHESTSRDDRLIVLREYLAMKAFSVLQQQQHQQQPNRDKDNNSNIVRLYSTIIPRDYNMFQDIYFVMEYLPMDLEQFWHRDRRMTLDSYCHSPGQCIELTRRKLRHETSSLMRQLLNGLRTIHQSGIIHTDLKPANLLIDYSQSSTHSSSSTKSPKSSKSSAPSFSTPPRLAICDFGMINDARSPIKELYVTTRSYRAPELCLSYKKCGSKVDMWSVGCIYAEMLLYMNRVIHEEMIKRMKKEKQSCNSSCCSDDTMGESMKHQPLFRARNSSELLKDILEKVGYECDSGERSPPPQHPVSSPTSQSSSSSIYGMFNSRRNSAREFDSLVAQYIVHHGLIVSSNCAERRQQLRRSPLFEHLNEPEDEPYFDLLFSLLQINPEKRLSVEQALTHPLFHRSMQGEEEEFGEEIDNRTVVPQAQPTIDVTMINSVDNVKLTTYHMVHQTTQKTFVASEQHPLDRAQQVLMLPYPFFHRRTTSSSLLSSSSPPSSPLSTTKQQNTYNNTN